MPPRINADGTVKLSDGSLTDLKTATGVAAAKADPAFDEAGEFAQLKSLMLARGFGFDEASGTFIDQREQGLDTRNIHGPGDGQVGRTIADEMVSNIFVSIGFADPYNANTFPQLSSRLRNFLDFNGFLRDSLESSLNDPSAANLRRFTGDVTRVRDEIGNCDLLSLIMCAFVEAIKENNEDKKYELKKLEEINIMGQQLAAYSKEVTDASVALGDKAKGKTEGDPRVDLQHKKFPLNGLDADGNLEQTLRSDKAPPGRPTDEEVAAKPNDTVLGYYDPTSNNVEKKKSNDQGTPVGFYDTEGGPATKKRLNGGEIDYSQTVVIDTVTGGKKKVHPIVIKGNKRKREEWDQKNGPYNPKDGEWVSANRQMIDGYLREVTGMEDQLRNMREKVKGQFQDKIDKGNQYMNLLLTVLKTMKEMKEIGPGGKAYM